LCPSAICHLPSAICHLPFAICHLPSAIAFPIPLRSPHFSDISSTSKKTRPGASPPRAVYLKQHLSLLSQSLDFTCVSVSSVSTSGSMPRLLFDFELNDFFSSSSSSSRLS